jgi:hypothetical protein
VKIVVGTAARTRVRVALAEERAQHGIAHERVRDEDRREGSDRRSRTGRNDNSRASRRERAGPPRPQRARRRSAAGLTRAKKARW